MTFFPIPIMMSIVVIVIGSYYKFGLRYLVLFLIPWQMNGWFWMSLGTTVIKPAQILFLALLFIVFFKIGNVRKSIGTSVIIMLTPFVISLVYNYYYFTPIEVFELEGDIREAGAKFRTSLNITNITRFIYLVFGMCLYLLFSTLYLDKRKLQRIIHAAIYFACSVGAIQVISWYIDLYFIYEVLFYPLSAHGLQMHQQTFTLPFGIELKRINGTFSEASFFGYYVVCTLLFYLLYFGIKEFFKRWAIRILILTGILSTSATFIWGFLGVVVIIYFFHTNKEYKIIFYFIFFILSVTLAFEAYESFTELKRGSINMRWQAGWVDPARAIVKSPLFGYALGTSFTQFIYTTLPLAIGFIGTIIFLYGLLSVPLSQNKKLYLFGILWLGLGNFYFASMEMWAYLGILSNNYLNNQNST